MKMPPTTAPTPPETDAEETTEQDALSRAFASIRASIDAAEKSLVTKRFQPPGESQDCPSCGGSGMADGSTCQTCGGSGKVSSSEEET